MIQTHLTKDKVQWQSFMNTVTDLCFHKRWAVLNQQRHLSFSRTAPYGVGYTAPSSTDSTKQIQI